MQRTIVRLKVLSLDHTPEQITALLGLSCDQCWLIGDKRAQTIIKEKTNGWVIGSGLPESATLDEHIYSLLSVLSARADLVRSLAATSEVLFSCVVYAESPPALYFDRDVIASLARLGANLDVDLYATEEDAF